MKRDVRHTLSELTIGHPLLMGYVMITPGRLRSEFRHLRHQAASSIARNLLVALSIRGSAVLFRASHLLPPDLVAHLHRRVSSSISINLLVQSVIFPYRGQLSR